MKQLLKCAFGSTLYGTALPTSDKDYKVVFLPDHDYLLMGKSLDNKVTQTSDTKNTSEDVDTEYVPLHRFVRDFVAGQTYALELAFCPVMNHPQGDTVGWTLPVEGTCRSDFYTFVQELRSKCLTKEVKAMVGYCRNQAKLYSAKGDRLKTYESVYESLSKVPQTDRLSLHKDKLPKNKYAFLCKTDDNRKAYEVCGGKHLLDVTVEEFLTRMKRDMDAYGQRAHKAKEDSGVDWKSYMHACRVAMEAEQLLTTHNLTFPFQGEEQKFLMDVRLGNKTVQEVSEFLDKKLETVEHLVETSTLPSKNDVWELAESMLLDFLKKQYTLK